MSAPADTGEYVGDENETGMPGRDEHNDGGLDAGDMHEAEQARERAAGETGEPNDNQAADLRVDVWDGPDLFDEVRP